MVYVAAEMQHEGFTIPLLIGGATTSRMHTAVKIAPAYQGPVVHVADASRSVPVVSSLLSQQGREAFTQQVQQDYAKLRADHQQKQSQKRFVTIEEARKHCLHTDWVQADLPRPTFIGRKEFINYPLEEIARYIDWTPFFQAWELAGRYPRILDDEVVGVEARKLLTDAQALLQEIIDNKLLQANAVLAFYPANSVGDDIEVYTDESRSHVLATVHTLRQQMSKAASAPNLALADYVAPVESNRTDYLGHFAVTTGIGLEELVARFEREHDDYNSIMAKALADRLAEAFAELLHERTRKEFWGYAPDEQLQNDDLIEEKYRGIRPAPGYPACPDHTEKGALFEVLQAGRIGITLTESYAMYPAAAVSGWYFAHPEARYFGIGKLQPDQLADYAQRKGYPLDVMERWLSPYLAYDVQPQVRPRPEPVQ